MGACGWAGELDTERKLANYITKNPPDESGLNLCESAAEGVDSTSNRKACRDKQRLAAKERKADIPDDGEDDDDTGDTNESSVEEEQQKNETNEKKKKKKKKS